MKLNWFKAVSGVVLLLSFSFATSAASYSEGKHFTKLDTVQKTQSGDKIEVLEFFWYGCPHCYQFEPTIQKWQKNKPENVHFIRIPAPLNPSWMVHTKTYYALELMGKGEQYHESLFKAMHVERKRLADFDSIANFLEKQGVDKKAFSDTFKSFAVEMRAYKAMQLAKAYKLDGVPMLAVNGKYTVSASQAGSYGKLIDIVKFLQTKEANSTK